MRIKRKFLGMAVIAIATLVSPLTTGAQTTDGKSGTTITIDGNTCKGLFSQRASTTSYDLYGYIRHKQAPIQIATSNFARVNDVGLLDTLQNNIMFATDSTLVLCRGTYSDSQGHTYFSIVAPKGYRFTRMTLDVDVEGSKTTAGNSTSFKSPENVVFNEVSIDVDGTVTNTGKSLTVNNTAGSTNILDITKTGSKTNKIYLDLYIPSQTDVWVIIKSLKLTYVIDDPFTEAMPNNEGTTGVHTDMIDLGTFYSNGYAWVFNSNNITDIQKVGIYTDSDGTVTETTPDVVTVKDNKYFVAATNGKYYVEAPAKFRIVGATVNFLRSDAEVTTTTYTDVTSITSGNEYLITDGNGHYLNNNNGSPAVGTDPAQATKWIITGSSSYTIKNGSYYLSRSSNNTLLLSTSSFSWNYKNSTGFYSSIYYLVGSSSEWSLIAFGNGNAKLQTEKVTTEVSYKGGDFTGTVYNRDDSGIEEDGEQKLSEAFDNASVSISGLNNDAIHFDISGLKDGENALYNVSFQLLPLDPEVQRLDVANKASDGVVTGNTTVSSVDYTFATNESSTAYIPVAEGESSYQIVFRKASNEQPTKWYKDGNSKDNDTNGYSNYFLVNSMSDIGGTTDAKLDVDNSESPTARVNVDQAGTQKLDFTNIGAFKRTETVNNPTEVKYNDFDKTKAAYGDVYLSLPTGATQTESKTVYVYTADQPTFNIMPAGSGVKHIDYRYYSITVAAVTTKATAKITITPIYTSTLKGVNNKNKSISRDESLDTSHHFVGITVEALLNGEPTTEGVLASKDIVEAIKTALASYNNYCGFGEDDPFRGILYLDMSSLKSSDNTELTAFNQGTADNCLYFMYTGYQGREGSLNVITRKTSSNDFEASSNINIYDQQPFFTPYAFATGTYTANYTREGTHDKATVKQMSCMLPFEIALDGEGHPMRASDATDTSVTFHDITGSGKVLNQILGGTDNYSYEVVAEAVRDDKAEANQPYHLITETEEGGFSFSITGANFIQTPAAMSGQAEADMSRGTTWEGHGTFAGQTPEKADTRFIFSSGVFHKTGAQVKNDVAYVLPFRAYFDTTDNNAKLSDTFSVTTDPNSFVTGINDVNADNNGVTICGGEGFISVTAETTTQVTVYSVSGQQVAHARQQAGATSRYSVPQGVYVVNGVKVIVK